MKSKNNQDVRQAILQFSYYLIALVFLAVCIFSGFMKTSSVEVDKILAKTQEYDHIRVKQIDLTESMDTLYFYTSLLNPDRKIYNTQMYNVISQRKQLFLETTSGMNEKDYRLYKKLAGQINTFLSMKDSIFQAASTEELVRIDLLRCISDNKKVTRRLSVEGISFDK